MTNQLESNEFNKERKYHLRGEVSDASVHNIVKNILKHNNDDAGKEYSSRKPIHLNIETYGGGVNEGLSLASAILESETPVYTFCRGRAMSMGFILFVVGHRRFISRFATLMFHDVAGGQMGKLESMIKSLEQSVRLRDYLIDITLETTDVPKEKLKEYVSLKEEWYMTSEEAIQYGCADEYIPEYRNSNRSLFGTNGFVEPTETVESNKSKEEVKDVLEDDEDFELLGNIGDGE